MNLNSVLQHGFASVPQLAQLRGIQRAQPQSESAPAAEPLPALGSTAVSRTDRAEISAAAKSAAGQELSADEQAEVEKLQRRDTEVRAHEQAHKAAAGRYAGAISYEYTSGPDGRRYASGGSVPIDTSPVEGDPEATVRKMQQVHQAAVAPANPSSADRNVAATAQRTMSEAQAEKLKLERDSESTTGPNSGSPANGASSTDDVAGDEARNQATVAGTSAETIGLAPPAPTESSSVSGASEAAALSLTATNAPRGATQSEAPSLVAKTRSVAQAYSATGSALTRAGRAGQVLDRSA